MELYWIIIVVALSVLNISLTVNADPVPFPCGYNYMSEAKAWFKFHTLEDQWDEAKRTCKSEGADLAPPQRNVIVRHMEFLMNISNSSLIHTAWGGPDNPLNDDTHKGKYIALSDNATLEVVSKYRQLPFICYKEAPQDLEMNKCGYTYEQGANKCYKLHRKHNTWDSARDSCLAEFGHLAIINGKAEEQVIQDIFARHPSDPVTSTERENTAHVGYHAYDGNWVTVLGQSLEEMEDKTGYRVWYIGEPNGARNGEYCGAVGRNGKLYDVSCNKQYYYICEKKVESCHEFLSMRLCLCPLGAIK